MLEIIQNAFDLLVCYGILLLEIASALVILYYSSKSVYFMFCRNHPKSHSVMTEGITTALNLLLGSEVLKTIVAPDWKDIGMTCAILAMRTGVSVLLLWENRNQNRSRSGNSRQETPDPK